MELHELANSLQTSHDEILQETYNLLRSRKAVDPSSRVANMDWIRHSLAATHLLKEMTDEHNYLPSPQLLSQISSMSWRLHWALSVWSVYPESHKEFERNWRL